MIRTYCSSSSEDKKLTAENQEILAYSKTEIEYIYIKINKMRHDTDGNTLGIEGAAADPRSMQGGDPRSMQGLDPRAMQRSDPRGIQGADPRAMQDADLRVMQGGDPRTSDPRMMQGVDPRMMPGSDPRSMSGVDPRAMQQGPAFGPRSAGNADPRTGYDPQTIAQGEDPRRPPVAEKSATGSGTRPKTIQESSDRCPRKCSSIVNQDVIIFYPPGKTFTSSDSFYNLRKFLCNNVRAILFKSCILTRCVMLYLILFVKIQLVIDGLSVSLIALNLKSLLENQLTPNASRELNRIGFTVIYSLFVIEYIFSFTKLLQYTFVSEPSLKSVFSLKPVNFVLHKYPRYVSPIPFSQIGLICISVAFYSPEYTLFALSLFPASAIFLDTMYKYLKF